MNKTTVYIFLVLIKELQTSDSIKKLERLQHKSRIGFYWNVVGKEPIVPSVQKS